MKHLLTLWMLALCLCVSAKETCPKVIPALQEWKGGRSEERRVGKECTG